METKVWNIKGEEVGKAELPNDMFGIKPSGTFLHEAVTNFLTNQRAWTAHTKTRSEVSGGGHKPWKQKHTGRARAGSNRSPLWRKGGTVFGPRYVDPQNRRMSMPRRKAQIALAHALSACAARDGIRVLDKIALDGSKTSQVARMLESLKADKRSLLVVEQHDKGLARASRNIPDFKVRLASDLNAYEVLQSDKVIVTQGALEKIRARWN